MAKVKNLTFEAWEIIESYYMSNDLPKAEFVKVNKKLINEIVNLSDLQKRYFTEKIEEEISWGKKYYEIAGLNDRMAFNKCYEDYLDLLEIIYKPFDYKVKDYDVPLFISAYRLY